MVKFWKTTAVLGLILSLAVGSAVQADEVMAYIPSAGIGVLLEQTLAEEDYLAAAEEAREERKALYGYSNLGMANVDNFLNVREKPSEDGKLVGKMSKNCGCEVVEVGEGWTKIRSGKVKGYVKNEFLLTGDAAMDKADRVATDMAVCNSGGLRVRKEPSTESAVITLVAEGESLEVKAQEGEWVKVLVDDEEAYVFAEYVNIAKKLDVAVTQTELRYGKGVSNVRVDLVNYAKQFLGNPYVWGGVSLTKGADCSGYVLSIFKKYGVSLPHSAAAQSNMGSAISLGEAKPGDLVFYSNNGRINHVAIYIGGGQVIHASNPRSGIKISNVGYRTPAKIRRMLKN